jgi:hypothetical protein
MGLHHPRGELTGNTKLTQHYTVTVLPPNNVLRFDIPVQQTILMKDTQGIANLMSIFNCFRFWQYIGLNEFS